MTGKQEMQDTVARALCRDNFNEPCAFCRAEARLAVAALVLGGYIRLDIGDLVEASSLGTPGAVDRANEIRAVAEGCMCEEFDNSEHPPAAAERATHASANRPAHSRSQCSFTYCGQVSLATVAEAEDMHAAPPDPTAQADPAIGSPTPPPPDIRRFYLYRHVDHSSVSGTGIVAWGAQWPDNTASLRWAGLHPSTVAWANVERIVAVHGHQGSTVLEWLDEEPQP